MPPETIELIAPDGVAIAAALFRPAGEPRAGVLIAPAMGVPQLFYAPFADWLAGQGYTVLTLDYRGIGKSRPASLRGFRADVLDWARLDCGAALARLRAESRDLPLYWIGHSLGGQIFPWVPGREAVARMITVATGSGYWKENAPRLRRFVWALWYLAVPLTLPLFGYFPGRLLRMIGDLPRGAMAQWRRWCLHPEYAAGVEPGARELYASVTTPISSISLTDDDYMSARNVESIHSFYTGSTRRMIRIDPAAAGEKAIGHFNFFRPRFEQTLWRPFLLPELHPAASASPLPASPEIRDA